MDDGLSKPPALVQSSQVHPTKFKMHAHAQSCIPSAALLQVHHQHFMVIYALVRSWSSANNQSFKAMDLNHAILIFLTVGAASAGA
jgi:hypothetical protein